MTLETKNLKSKKIFVPQKNWKHEIYIRMKATVQFLFMKVMIIDTSEWPSCFTISKTDKPNWPDVWWFCRDKMLRKESCHLIGQVTWLFDLNFTAFTDVKIRFLSRARSVVIRSFPLLLAIFLENFLLFCVLPKLLQRGTRAIGSSFGIYIRFESIFGILAMKFANILYVKRNYDFVNCLSFACHFMCTKLVLHECMTLFSRVCMTSIYTILYCW